MPPAESPTPSETAPLAPIADDPAGFATTVVEGSDANWEGVHFVTPSNNEGCAILGADSPEPYLWGCALAAQDWSVPKDDPADYCYDAQIPCGYGIEVTAGDPPHPRYRGDPGFPAATTIFETTGPRTPVATLAYGHSVTYGDVICESAESGVTCSNTASGHGFTVSRAAYELH